MNNVQNELNTMLKKFEDKPTLNTPKYVPQQKTTDQSQKNSNIKIEIK